MSQTTRGGGGKNWGVNSVFRDLHSRQFILVTGRLGESYDGDGGGTKMGDACGGVLAWDSPRARVCVRGRGARIQNVDKNTVMALMVVVVEACRCIGGVLAYDLRERERDGTSECFEVPPLALGAIEFY